MEVFQKLARRGARCMAAAAFLAAGAAASAGSGQIARASEFNVPGNIVIADQFNNRVVEVNAEHHVVWSFGNGSSVAGPHSVVGPNDAERVGELTLVSGTGTPAGADPSCTSSTGCPDNRVMLIGPDGGIVWQYGQAGVSGSGFNRLNTPVCSVYLPNGHILITDQANERVIEVTRDKHIVWQHGTTGTTGSGPDQLNNPNSAERLANGDTLIADENNNRVIEVNHAKNIVWSYGSPADTKSLNGAAFASRLPNGHTLITDSLNNRIVEVEGSHEVEWTYHTNARDGSVAAPNPTRAVRLRNGDTLISDQFNDQVIRVNQEKEIVFKQGYINVDGDDFDQLNAPYDAKVVGDYTGLTPPFD
ncbi:MAG: hypothetical protein ACR2JC_08335 [Chloroflexota bacterium]